METIMKDAIKALVTQTTTAPNGNDAMKYAQAALSLAYVLQIMQKLEMLE